MHELSIAEELLEIIETRARDAGIHRVERITLKIGEYSGIMPEALEFAFLVLSRGRCTEGAEIEMQAVAPEYLCKKCGLTQPAPQEGCSGCGSFDLTLKRGNELSIVSFEGE
ncbi:MAG: hydrogenase maturation nickel metallochaperone HypA [Spirochaetes bacterium]|nr:hydrogenase maturation nickel metallochaperone HypA [Spirochaetota bacterium]